MTLPIELQRIVGKFNAQVNELTGMPVKDFSVLYALNAKPGIEVYARDLPVTTPTLNRLVEEGYLLCSVSALDDETPIYMLSDASSRLLQTTHQELLLLGAQLRDEVSTWLDKQ